VRAVSDILLATLNAKYIHTAFGLRYLLANLGALRARAALVEFDLTQRPLEIVEQLLAREPRIVGFGVYIWNVTATTEVVALLKRLRSQVTVVLGGPEVSYETDLPPITAMADYVITGEGDLKFAELCQAVLAGRSPEKPPGTVSGPSFLNPERSPLGIPPAPRVIPAGYASLPSLALPYDLYSDADLAHRVVYVEASRGCPFGCEFCLSSLEVPVRQFDLDGFLAAMDRLLERGARQFKFVDRTFNLNLRVSRRILEFFLERQGDGLFLHFEMVPDRLPPELREVLARFPAGTVQLEVGIQTFNEAVARRIQRPQDYGQIAENLRFLRRQTGVHLHADLILGLPGESLASMADGFDQLVALGPHEIQVGILKRLRGAPIIRHDAEWGLVYSPLPPYELVESRTLDFPTLQRLRRLARYWDLIGNSGNFVAITPRLWAEGGSPFQAVLAFSDWLFEQVGRPHAIALPRLAALLFTYLTEVKGQDRAAVAADLRRDYQRGGRSEDLPFLRGGAGGAATGAGTIPRKRRDRRQARHRA